MKRTSVITGSILSVFLAMGLAPATVRADTETIETARLLAILHDSGRVTIAGIQALINDPETGDKGFTPEVFEKKLIEKFKERSGVDLTKLKTEKVPAQAKQMLPMLVESCKKVVLTYQPILNKKGLAYKNFIPATFGTQCAAIFTARTGTYLKQTTFDDVLRNPRNKADEFEASVLKKFADPSYPRQGEKVISETVDGGKAVRLLLPLFHVKGCLPCHGEPKGERDISGYLREGGKLGELAGAISVKVPVR